MHSGTSGHGSALKKVSALKYSAADPIGEKGLYMSDMSWGEGVTKSETMKDEGNLNTWVAKRKKLEAKHGGDKKAYKSDIEWQKNQDRINEALIKNATKKDLKKL